MGSRRFAGVRFVVYSDDHEPRHVHGFSDDGEVVIDLLDDGNVALANRKKAIRDAKASTVRKVLKAADEHYLDLCELWASIHGEPKTKGTSNGDNDNNEGDRSGD